MLLRPPATDYDAGLVLNSSDLGLALVFGEGANAANLPGDLRLNRCVIGRGAPRGCRTGREDRDEGCRQGSQSWRQEVCWGDHERALLNWASPWPRVLLAEGTRSRLTLDTRSASATEHAGHYNFFRPAVYFLTHRKRLTPDAAVAQAAGGRGDVFFSFVTRHVGSRRMGPHCRGGRCNWVLRGSPLFTAG